MSFLDQVLEHISITVGPGQGSCKKGQNKYFSLLGATGPQEEEEGQSERSSFPQTHQQMCVGP